MFKGLESKGFLRCDSHMSQKIFDFWAMNIRAERESSDASDPIIPSIVARNI